MTPKFDPSNLNLAGYSEKSKTIYNGRSGPILSDKFDKSDPV